MKLRHVVVDGSNIATEGREAPSLAQLDEAVQAFIREFEPERVTVVVDATFPNRINRNERKVYEDAVAAGEVITPPAGAIGRGDAFVLQIADRAGATVLSNDSFQEFHGEYHWLFDKGRLVGGKPVPHVGWVFMDRAPVRGPTSRRATSAAARRGRGRERDTARPDGSTPAPAPSKAPEIPETSAGGAARGGTAPAEAPRKRRRSKRAVEPVEPVEAVDAVEAVAEHEPPPPSPEPIEPAEPAVAVAGAPDVASPPAYNEPGPFGDFLARHPVGSDVEAVVESFGSHGAYLRCRSVRAYAPLKNLADPAPRSAKEVLKAGETRTFVVAEVDRARRGVDLALAGTPTAVAAVASRPPDQPKQPKRAKAAKKQAPAKAARSDKPDKSAKAARSDKPDKSAKADTADRSAKADRSDKSARAARSDRSAKADGPAADGTAGPSKQARAKKTARADKAERVSKSAKKASAEKKAATNPRQ